MKYCIIKKIMKGKLKENHQKNKPTTMSANFSYSRKHRLVF